MPFLPAQRCSSTEVGQIFRHKTFVLTPTLGEFYGHNLAATNLEMIARFFEKYPDYVDKTFLSVKVQSIPPSAYKWLNICFPGRNKDWRSATT